MHHCRRLQEHALTWRTCRLAPAVVESSLTFFIYTYLLGARTVSKKSYKGSVHRLEEHARTWRTCRLASAVVESSLTLFFNHDHVSILHTVCIDTHTYGQHSSWCRGNTPCIFLPVGKHFFKPCCYLEYKSKHPAACMHCFLYSVIQGRATFIGHVFGNGACSHHCDSHIKKPKNRLR